MKFEEHHSISFFVVFQFPNDKYKMLVTIIIHQYQSVS